VFRILLISSPEVACKSSNPFCSSSLSFRNLLAAANWATIYFPLSPNWLLKSIDVPSNSLIFKLAATNSF